MSDALTGNRQFVKEIPNTTATWNNLAGEFTATDGWRVEANAIYYETYWDMSPYTLNDLTYFPITAVLQDGQTYLYSMTDPTDAGITVLDIVSQEPLDITTVMDGVNQLNVPSQPKSPNNFTQILMAQFRRFLPTTQFSTTTLMTPATLGQFGSLEPTACEKLHIYRIVAPSATNLTQGDTFSIPATRFIMNGAVAKESELEYMMRLKRSYELAQ